MRNIAKIELVAGLYRIRLLPAGVRYPQTGIAQPSYKLAVRHIKVRFPGFQIVDAKTFDREEERRFTEARRARNQSAAKEGLEA
jgi:hypothetical protein